MPKTEIIRIKLLTLGGRKSVDIRRCLGTPSGPIPTSHGLSIPIEKLDEILEKAFLANGKEEFVEL